MAIPSASGNAVTRPDHLHVVDEYAAIPVVLACATADLAAVQAAVRPLGDAAEAIGGLEEDPDELRGAAQLAMAPTLFVVCKTDALSPTAVRRAVEIFGGRGKAGHRMLVLELVPQRAAGFVATVRRARAQLGRACEQSGIAAKVGMRDSSFVETVGGETHVDHALARMEPPQADLPVAPHVDRVGPIPPHVRAPSEPARPHLSIVDPNGETSQDLEVPSYVDLVPPEPPVAAITQSRPRLGVDVRVIVVVVAAIAATIVVFVAA